MLKRAYEEVLLLLLILVLPSLFWMQDGGVFSLGGVEVPKKVRSLGVSDYFSGRFQASLEEWYAQGFPVRPLLVYFLNTLEFEVLGDPISGATLSSGRDGSIFFFQDIALLRADNIASQAIYSTQVDRLAALQKLALRHRKLILPVFVPSKTSIMSAEDNLCDKYNSRPQDRPSLAVHSRFKKAADRSGLIYVDARTLLADEYKKSGILPFPKAGRHWSEYSACLAMEEVKGKVRHYLDREVPESSCRPARYGAPTATDVDLLPLANIFSLKDRGYLGIFPAQKTLKSHVDAIKTLFVGSSFNWQMISDTVTDFWSSLPVSYYSYNRYRYSVGSRLQLVQPEERSARAIDGKDSDPWYAAAWDNDLIVVELLESFMGEGLADYGFVEGLSAWLAKRGYRHLKPH